MPLKNMGGESESVPPGGPSSTICWRAAWPARAGHRRRRQRPRGGAREPVGRRAGAALHGSQGTQPPRPRTDHPDDEIKAKASTTGAASIATDCPAAVARAACEEAWPPPRPAPRSPPPSPKGRRSSPCRPAIAPHRVSAGRRETSSVTACPATASHGRLGPTSSDRPATAAGRRRRSRAHRAAARHRSGSPRRPREKSTSAAA